MSDTDSIKTDMSHSDLQQKYDRLAMEFAKNRMQLNVLKKAYTSKISKMDHISIESLDQFENCKYDAMSTSSLDLLDDFNESRKVRRAEELKYNNVHLLKQDINTINQYIRRVLECTKSNQLDYNLIMSEIDYCKGVQNSCPSNFCKELNNELTTLKCSVSACLYNLLYNKLESRTKINTEDSRLIYPNHYCLETTYKTDEERFQKVFIILVLHFFLSFIVNLHDVLDYLLKEVNPDTFLILQSTLNGMTNQLKSYSVVLENILVYCDYLKNLKYDSQPILLENILQFISNKYIEFVEHIKAFIKSDNVQFDYSALRQSIVSFMALKFPIEELVSSSEYWDSNIINKKMNDVFDTVHTLLRAINILEFEYLYKCSQVDMHWHMKNPILHINNSRKAKEELNFESVSQNSYEKIITVYNEKLNLEMNRSLSLEQEKIHWEHEYELLCKKNKTITDKGVNFESSGPFIIENQLGKCESSSQLNDEILAREKELKSYFQKQMNNLISSNKELSSKSNAYAIENTALKTQVDHSILVRNNLEVKLQDALEHIEDLKEEFYLTSTNYETQLKTMTEHLASLNETIVLERKHIDDLSNQLKTKSNKKPSK